MKELIIQALDKAYSMLDDRLDKTKRETREINVDDVLPVDLAKFMEDNNIPRDAWLYADLEYNLYLQWDVTVPTTDKDKLIQSRRIFSDIAFREVYSLLAANGYKRVGFNTGLLNQFNDTTVYDMYMEKDFDRLIKYYSLPFVLKED